MSKTKTTRIEKALGLAAKAVEDAKARTAGQLALCIMETLDYHEADDKAFDRAKDALAKALREVL